MPNWLQKVYWNAFTLWHFAAEARLPYRPLAEIHAILAATLRAILGENIAVDLERVDAIPPQPNGKVKAVISHYCS